MGTLYRLCYVILQSCTRLPLGLRSFCKPPNSRKELIIVVNEGSNSRQNSRFKKIFHGFNTISVLNGKKKPKKSWKYALGWLYVTRFLRTTIKSHLGRYRFIILIISKPNTEWASNLSQTAEEGGIRATVHLQQNNLEDNAIIW